MHRAFILLPLLVVLCLFAPMAAQAHPHIYMECEATFVFDQNGLSAIRHHWVFDELFTATLVEIIDVNRNGAVDADEVDVAFNEAFINLENYHYFMAISVDGQPRAVERIDDFHAELRPDGKLAYTFSVPCPVAASSDAKTVKVAVYDETFYVFVAYGDGDSGFDPFADTQFVDPNAPANPGDFNRFVGEAGAPVYSGEVAMDGAHDRFVVQSVVESCPEMRYFYDEIVPDAFVVSFRLP